MLRNCLRMARISAFRAAEELPPGETFSWRLFCETKAVGTTFAARSGFPIRNALRTGCVAETGAADGALPFTDG